METNIQQFPEIDDILGGILSPDEPRLARQAAAAPHESGFVTDEETEAGAPGPEEPSVPTGETAVFESGRSPLADVKALIGRLPGLGDDTDTYMVRIYFDILSTLRACDFGTKSIPKIVNAILIDFIEKNKDGLRAIVRRTYL